MRLLQSLRSFAMTTLLFFLVAPALSQEQPVLAQELATARLRPILHNGRIKPFDSFARETLEQITGSPRIGRADPVETVLSIMAQPGDWQEKPLLSVPFIPLREALGMDLKTTHVSYNELVATRRMMRMLPSIVQKQQRDERMSMLENETMDLYGRFVAFSGLIEQNLHWVPAEELADRRWRLRLEVIYNRVAPFRIARIVYGVAFLGFLLVLLHWKRDGSGTVPKYRSTRPLWMAGMGALAAGFLVHLAGILARVIVGSRPPVSNFYETMLWLPFVAVGLALIFERITRTGFFGLAAAILGALVLLLADHLPLDPSISPVVAVLRSNLWLTIHVLTIVASYGALTLAMVLAHIYGGFFLSQGAKHPSLVSLETFLYRGIQVGVVLLAGGIMLGGVWANASWGRYWGWDPKETWALITLLWFLAMLHGRFAGWIKGIGLALGTIGGFFLLLMTYYGVSFYLVGLHSYAGGHAKPLPPLLVGYLVAELAFMTAVGLRAAGSKAKSA